MKFIKNTLKRVIKWAMSDNEDIRMPEPDYSNAKVARSSRVNTIGGSSSLDNTDGLDFTIYNAVGGKVVRISTYNPHIDRYSTNLYVITDKEDLGQEIGQILTRESLSR